MLLAGDLGGTRTRLGLYEREAPRPRQVLVREFLTLEHAGLAEMIEDLLGSADARGVKVEVAAIGVAGPLVDQEAQLTNVPWRVSARQVAERTGVPSVVLLNDVEAMAHAIEALAPNERRILQEGDADPTAAAALLSLGTGVGMAILHRVDGTFQPMPSEGGHADFAPRNEREIALLRALRHKYGRVDIERVISGPGLANIARFTHGGACTQFPVDLPPLEEPAQVTRAGLDHTCASCRDALEMFAEAVGAAAGNLALTAKSTGGLYLGGGIPPKVLPILDTDGFRSAFVSKSPVDALVRSVPVTVITLDEAGLLGAAVFAARR